ncbi:MAG: hypothetical protein WD052_12745 [Bacteroidales bacterium]
MIRSFRFFIFNLLLLVTFTGCKNDPLHVDISDTDLQVEIQRFDREVFNLNFDEIDQAISGFYDKYGDFYDVYNVHVINIGPASQKYYGSYLSMFVNDPDNYSVYEYTQEIFPDLTDSEVELTAAFKRYHYHFPDSAVPEIVGYVSRFNHKLFTVENYIGLGLDQYLGRNCKFYDMLRTPRYMQYNMHPGKIPSDVVHVWGTAKFPYNDSIDNVLNRLVYNGLLLYFTDALLPDMADSLKIGFSPDQLRFCQKHEKEMWTYLVEHKLLFSTDLLEIRKLTDDAPTTYYFPGESPGRAAVWLGWQIVREYARRNPELSVAEIVSEQDYQKILRIAKYNPR